MGEFQQGQPIILVILGQIFVVRIVKQHDGFPLRFSRVYFYGEGDTLIVHCIFQTFKWIPKPMYFPGHVGTI